MRSRAWLSPAWGAFLTVSLAMTEGILLAEGRWREALPLHLCSLAALAALVLSLRPKQGLLDFLWYLGGPGALLALLFPAPAVTQYQLPLNISYGITHALIIVIPLAAMKRGMRPRSGRAVAMMITIQAIALVAYGVNRALGTDYLFLMAPPAGTPLEWVFAWGKTAYWLFLEGLVLALVTIMGAAAAHLNHKRTQ